MTHWVSAERIAEMEKNAEIARSLGWRNILILKTAGVSFGIPPGQPLGSLMDYVPEFTKEERKTK